MIKEILKFWVVILIAVLSSYLVDFVYLNLIMRAFLYVFTDMIQHDFGIILNFIIWNAFIFFTFTVLAFCTSIVGHVLYYVNLFMFRVNRNVAVPVVSIYFLYKFIGIFYNLFVAFASNLTNQLGYGFVFYTWAIIILLIIVGLYFGVVIGGLMKWYTE